MRISASLCRTALALAVVALAGSSARADLILNLDITDSSATVGSTGSFDVLATVPSGSTLATVGAYVLNLVSSDSSSVHFLSASVTTPPSPAYIFAQGGSFGFEADVTASSVNNAGDSSLLLAGQPVMTATTYGLIHVVYQAIAATANPVLVSFVDLGGATSLTDGDDNPITIGTAGVGRITVTAAAIPEPSPLILSGLTASLALAGRFRRKVFQR